VPSLRSGPLLLRAEDPFKHGGVPEVLGFDDFAVAEREYIGFGCGFPAGGDLGEDDHDIVSSARKRLGTIAKDFLGHLREQFCDPCFAAIRSADGAVTGYDKLDVVVVVAQDRFDVARAERGVPLLGFLCLGFARAGFPRNGLILPSRRDSRGHIDARSRGIGLAAAPCPRASRTPVGAADFSGCIADERKFGETSGR
jgi:hypothetical protein